NGLPPAGTKRHGGQARRTAKCATKDRRPQQAAPTDQRARVRAIRPDKIPHDQCSSALQEGGKLRN
ncbi:hypothetical protein NDN95_29360, partial [Burkholderia glumae]|uniref:hypothetical protein n=1 Tax=Burkholderia glumae TaxID=337 RepID=UPI002037599A